MHNTNIPQCDVHSVTQSTHQGFPELRDGNRAVRISLSKDVPGVVAVAGFECRVRHGYCRQPAFGRSAKLWAIVAIPVCVPLCRGCLVITPVPFSNMWAIPRPAAPAAFPWTLQASPLPIYVALSTLRPRRKSVEMSDEDFFIPSQSDV